ncbi:MAG: metallophosphoesterase [Bryobacterales bacterium]|nr:metallophosphoesterase [Bryobacterales bacterium]
MKILVFSDIHGDYRALERLMETEADYYFAAGDLASWGRGLDGCGEILRRRAGQMYVLPGNHESAAMTSALCRKYGLQHFHERSFEAGGLHFAGLGYSSPTPFNTPGEYSEEELGQRLARFAALRPLVLICHCPPYGTLLDRVREGVHAGSRAVAAFIAEHQPVVFCSGHIHEAAGVRTMLGATRGYAAGPKGRLIDFDKLEDV